jgi:hypothetical protein
MGMSWYCFVLYFGGMLLLFLSPCASSYVWSFCVLLGFLIISVFLMFCWASQHQDRVFLLLLVFWQKLSLLVNVFHLLQGVDQISGHVVVVCHYCMCCCWSSLNICVTCYCSYHLGFFCFTRVGVLLSCLLIYYWCFIVVYLSTLLCQLQSWKLLNI